MADRTDIHRPSVMVPADYTFVGCFYVGSSDDMAISYKAEHTALERYFGNDEWWTDERFFSGNHANKGSCDLCGTYFAHGVVFRHDPSGEFVSVGHTCAGTTFLPGADKAARVRALAEKETKRLKRVAENRETRARLIAENPGLEEALEADHKISRDLKHHFYGSYPDDFTEKRIELAFKAAVWAAENAERATKWEAEAAEAADAPTGKGIVFTGTVLKTDTKYTDWGTRFVFTVKSDDGWRAWGTVPGDLSDVTKGDRVRFTANFDASDDDAKFAFFKRPRKAEVLSGDDEFAEVA